MKSSVLPFAFRGIAVAACVSIVTVGCGDGGAKPKGSSTPKVKVTGTVKLDGNPVPGGSITYLSTATGNAAVGTIKDGAYEIPAKDGPNPGESGVIIKGKEEANGPEVWIWSSKTPVKVGADSHKEYFAIDKKNTKPAPKIDTET